MDTNYSILLSIFGFVFFFIIIILLAYLTTKFYSKYQKKSGKNIRILEVFYVAPQKSLQLIEISNRVFLIGVTKEEIVLLHKFEGEINFQNMNQEYGDIKSFSKVLTKHMNRKKGEFEQNDDKE